MTKRGMLGKTLEHYLNGICRDINSLGYHAHKNQVLRTFSGLYLEGEPFDYEIFAKNEIHVFDAKENYSGVDWWKIRQTGQWAASSNRKMLKQAENLAACKKSCDCVRAYFLVYFGNEKSEVYGKCISFDAEIILDKLINKEPKVHYSLGFEWDISRIQL